MFTSEASHHQRTAVESEQQGGSEPSDLVSTKSAKGTSKHLPGSWEMLVGETNHFFMDIWRTLWANLTSMTTHPKEHHLFRADDQRKSCFLLRPWHSVWVSAVESRSEWVPSWSPYWMTQRWASQNSPLKTILSTVQCQSCPSICASFHSTSARYMPANIHREE